MLGFANLIALDDNGGTMVFRNETIKGGNLTLHLKLITTVKSTILTK